MQTDLLRTYRFTASVPRYGEPHEMVEMTYVIEADGLSVTRGRSMKLVPWKSLRFLHLHVTSGVGTSGFPIYSARLRTLFVSQEITSLDWHSQDPFREKGADRSADYVRFMEALVPVAAARNPRLRLRKGGDPMLETTIPIVLCLFVVPLLSLLLMFLKFPLGVAAVGLKGFLAKVAPWLFSTGFGVAVNALPWSSGKPFEAHALPAEELPLRYRASGA